VGRVRFRGRDVVRITFSDRNVVPGSTKYVDPGTHLTLQNQDMCKHHVWLSQVGE